MIRFLIIAITFLVCSAFQVPTAGEYEGLLDYRNKIQESEIQNSRSANPVRRASENKRPWNNESFLDMEGYVAPKWPTWNLPGYPDNPWDVPKPDHIPNEVIIPYWNIAGCGFSTLTFITDCEMEYEFSFLYLYGVVVSWSITGPITYAELDTSSLPTKIVFQPLPNADYGSEVCVEAWTRSLKQGEIDGHCKTCTKLYCEEECECLGFTPDIYASSATIAAGGSITLYVDSGGTACPDYEWSVSGTGYSIDSTTENDLETVTLTSAAGT